MLIAYCLSAYLFMLILHIYGLIRFGAWDSHSPWWFPLAAPFTVFCFVLMAVVSVLSFGMLKMSLGLKILALVGFPTLNYLVHRWIAKRWFKTDGKPRKAVNSEESPEA